MASAVSGALLDTSVLIAAQVDVDELPATAAISVITLGELHAGVHLARFGGTRQLRQRRLDSVRRSFAPIPVDEHVAEHFGKVLAVARRERRVTKATDVLIIATAGATARTLHTLDTAQARLARAVGVAVA